MRYAYTIISTYRTRRTNVTISSRAVDASNFAVEIVQTNPSPIRPPRVTGVVVRVYVAPAFTHARESKFLSAATSLHDASTPTNVSLAARFVAIAEQSGVKNARSSIQRLRKRLPTAKCRFDDAFEVFSKTIGYPFRVRNDVRPKRQLSSNEDVSLLWRMVSSVPVHRRRFRFIHSFLTIPTSGLA